LFEFRVVAEDPETRARAGEFMTPHGVVETPVFMPVGTQATVKTLAPSDLHEIGAQIILANAYHLYLRPGTDVIQSAGGIHRFMGWDRVLLTDSGGFQIFSLQGLTKATDEGLEFQSHLDGSRHFMTPEDNVRVQREIGADIIMALDECVAYPATRSQASGSSELTLRWAERALAAWETAPPDQALFGIVQGATYSDLRRDAARALSEMGFTGFAIGGLAVGEPAGAMREMVEVVVAELPSEKPRYFMGQGFPEDIVGSVAQGIDMFDCVMPTRNARKGSVFTSRGRLVVKNAEYADDLEPLDPECSCYACRMFSRAYIRHLFQAEELLAGRLATLHSLTFYIKMMRDMRGSILAGRFGTWRRRFLEKQAMNRDDGIGPAGGAAA
jgi:queuine tRNA-ribosyltransferase